MYLGTSNIRGSGEGELKMGFSIVDKESSIEVCCQARKEKKDTTDTTKT
jgi:hypothetical protein